MVKRQAYQPILITDASRSQDDQLTSRQKRYVLMMGIRVACVIAGAILVGVEAPLLWLWLPLCAVGMVLIPWLAVLLANDRPPKEQHRLAGKFQPRMRDETPPMSLTAEERPHKIIDVEP
ncbi:putative tellurium resistance membrane protein TerC [Micromonospora sp. A200]|nr:putative tellurium resistance membrane protein TerC [Micromonospora sp. A200]